MQINSLNLPEYLQQTYQKHIDEINYRLSEFHAIMLKNDTELYFYEFCFCILTLQTRAKNAIIVQKKLIERDFLNKKFDPTPILSNKKHYIRFHNQKAKRLLNAIVVLPELMQILNDKNTDVKTKRMNIRKNFVGFGMKESSHFLRNIGYRNLAILDRHIVRHLNICGITKDVVPPNTDSRYLQMEQNFLDFCDEINIPIDIMDFLFFAYSNGSVLK